MPPDAQPCFGTYANVCLSALPDTSITVTTTLDINTDISSDKCDAKIPQYCVVAATSFSIQTGGKLTAHGARPLVLVSTDKSSTFDLKGAIDVSSSSLGSTPVTGPGANPPDCTTGTPAPTAATALGGGFGGSFGSQGGDGNDGGTVATDKGVAGSPLATFPTSLRGGCPGGAGSTPGANGESAGGAGGGAIYIIVPNFNITADGSINASGAAGRGGTQGPTTISGGGGGGSGGMIVIESTITADAKAKIWANGGGGAQGGSTTATGVDGNESGGPIIPALATNSSTKGSNGGGGSAANGDGADGINDPSPGAAGGGGGGGAGIVHAPNISNVSPPSRDPA